MKERPLHATDCVQEEIYSSSYAAAAYLESINFKKKVRAQDTTWPCTNIQLFDLLCSDFRGQGEKTDVLSQCDQEKLIPFVSVQTRN